MTFTERVKANLLNADFASAEERHAEVYAYLLFLGTFYDEKVVVDSENEKVIDRIQAILSDGERSETNGKRKYRLEISRELADRYLNDEEKIDTDREFSAFLRASFLSVGNASNPEKEYRVEFIFKEMSQCISFMEILSERPVLLSFNQRADRFVAYTKDSSLIEDILVLMGAGSSSLEIMNAKIQRDITNKMNRVLNCDSANMRKTEQNAVKEIDAINYILEKDESILSEEQLFVARLRLQNPEMSLSELTKECGNKISRSGMYHRLKKIVSIAEELSKKEAKR